MGQPGTYEADSPSGGASVGRRTTLTLNADQVTLLAQGWPLSTAIYFVRTVCALTRLKSETGPPARMQDDMLRVFAVFLEGLEMIATGAESKDAQRRPGEVSPPSGESDGAGGSEMSSVSWKLLAFCVPVTCKNLKLAVMLLSRGAFWPGVRSPFSDMTAMASCCERMCHTGPSMCTTGGGQRKRFSLPYDFWATAACRHMTVVMGMTREGSCETWSRTIRRILL